MGGYTCDRCGAIATVFYRDIGDTHIDYACPVHALESGKAWRSLTGFGAAIHAAAQAAATARRAILGEDDEE
jgi:hypothetical protein